jgi:hypothetical protein
MKTKTPKQVAIQWTYQRRVWLIKAIQDKYPRYNYEDKIKQRSFSDEAASMLPKLFKEIEAHNKKAYIQNNLVSTSNEKRQSKLVALARLGTEAQCDSIAKDMLRSAFSKTRS